MFLIYQKQGKQTCKALCLQCMISLRFLKEEQMFEKKIVKLGLQEQL